jgi:hypothetical protein
VRRGILPRLTTCPALLGGISCGISPTLPVSLGQNGGTYGQTSTLLLWIAPS